MVQIGLNVELFQKPVRWYIDQAEWPAVGLAVVIIATYATSFWLNWSYVRLVFPLILIYQVIAAVLNGYLSLKRSADLKQTAVICLLTAVAGGLVSAVAALLRFWYPWLFFSFFAEPIWSGLLSVIVGGLSFGFFHLPKLAKVPSDVSVDDNHNQLN